MNKSLLVLSVLPVVVLALYVYRKDRMQKEPLGMLLKAFAMGMLSVLPAVALESALSLGNPGLPVLDGLYDGFVVAGFSEELCKLVMLYWAVWKSRHFDEYFDGIVYATFVSLGFACVENVGYVFGAEDYASAFQTGTMRAVLSVPGHFLFGVAMGYFFGRAKFEPARRKGHMVKALVMPWLLHGTYDALLMVPESMGSDLLTGVLFVVFVWFDIKLWKIGLRKLNALQQLSEQQASIHSPEETPLDHIDWNV